MSPRVATLRAELRVDSVFVATPTPRLSWTIVDADRWIQAAVEVRSGAEVVTLRTQESVLVEWPFSPLAEGESRSVEVRATATSGVVTPWSAPLVIRAGFVSEWTAQPIGLANPSTDAQPALVRTSFTVGNGLATALLYYTALGVAAPEINGSRVDDDVLAPGWTSYRDRLIHETVDVTTLLSPGENVLGATVAGAWYTEKFGFFTFTDRVYGDQPSFIAQLELTYDDGRRERVVTDETWFASADTPVVSSGIYAGEHYDARRGDAVWATSSAGAEGWTPVRVGAVAREGYEVVPVPEARIAAPVRRIEERAVSTTFAAPSGATILDFAQNLVGRLRLTVSGPAGTVLTLRHAEVLENGELSLRPLRNAAATDTYVLAGAGAETWEPAFTFHGFRYATIEGWPGEFDPAAVTAVVLHSDMERTGWFESSHPMLDRLHENVVWGMRGNFLSIPTDCPQRDERLGWTGDLQVFAPTASFLYDCEGFLVSWLRDLAHEQSHANGVVPMVVPSVLGGFGGSTGGIAAWGDAATVAPYVLHERFGDVAVLRDQYESMRAWADVVLRESTNGLWSGTFQLGDWLDPSAPPDKPAQARVDSDIVASAYLARSLRIVAQTATILGLDDDAARFDALAETSRAAFVAEYVTPAGRMMSDAVTAYALALQFDLVTDTATRSRLAARLADLVRANGYRIATGFVGTPLVADALSASGHLYAAERLLLSTDNPSWLYSVSMGATTVWERWDSLLPDGSVNPGEMTSFNHYALGAVADWMHRVVAGLGADSPGYRRIRIAPRPLDALEHASAKHLTPYGEAEVSWRRDGAHVVVEATVPPNATAIVDLPGIPQTEVGSGRHEWRFDSVSTTPARIPLGVESSTASILDDREAYAALMTTLASLDPERAAAVLADTRWVEGRTLRQSLMWVDPEILDALDGVLTEATGASHV